MRALRKPVWTLVVLFVSLSISQAKTNYGYVANYGNGTVTVINTANNTVVKTITVGLNPQIVAVDQAGKAVYVPNTGSNDVSVITTSTNTVTATIPVGSSPIGVAFAPNGKTAYVSNYGSNSVSVINAGTKKVTATVTVQSNPVGIAVTPNGAFVYVDNVHSGNVSVISTLTNKVVATIPVAPGTNAATIAISPDGSTAYVPGVSSNTITVIRLADNTVVNTITAGLNGPNGASVSPDGHWLYVTESASNVVTVIDVGTQTVVANIVVGSAPQYVAFTQDSAFAYVTNYNTSDVSVVETASQTVVKTISGVPGGLGVTVMGTMKVSTVAGGYIGDKGPATSAALDAPFSTVQDKAGNYYVSDRYKHRIRKITPSRTITTIAGTGICGYNGDNIPANKATLCFPKGLALDSAGNLYEADGTNRVRKISTNGTITTVAGTGLFGYSGDGGPATSATLRDPFYIVFDSAGNMYFSEVLNHVVRKVDTTGTISTYAGTGTAGFSGDGGPAKSAMLNYPRGIGFETSGNLYIADAVNRRVRIVSSSGIINTFAGTGQPGCNGDGGPALNARVNPQGITVNNGSLYIAGCSRIRVIDLNTDVINTVAGSFSGYDGDNNPPLSSRFFLPTDTVFDAAGNLLTDDSFNDRLRKLSGGVFTTFAGGYLGDGNPATSGALVFPEALSIDKANNLYIADWAGHRIRKVSGGKISTIAGTGVNGYSGDGGSASSAQLNFPQGVAVDSNGRVAHSSPVLA